MNSDKNNPGRDRPKLVERPLQKQSKKAVILVAKRIYSVR